MEENNAPERVHRKKEFSAGGVVFKKVEGEPLILLISWKGNYGFPKGWIGDHGAETVEAAALREVREEGGVEAKILKDLGEIHYFFSFKGTPISKTVHFYLMEYVSGDPKDHDHEVDEARFVSIKEAGQLLVRKTDLEVLARAENALKDI